jgi:hypothetical protein|tara:strand:- start:245 stop:955 length:711 start_codon:yes stop_codon:yes gene_type:complete
MLFYDDLHQYLDDQIAKLQTLKSADMPNEGVILEVLGPANDQNIESNPGGHSVTQRVDELRIDHQGILGDRHRGLTRSSRSREYPLYHRTHSQIVNRRQLMVVSEDECTALTDALGVEITPELLGANLVIRSTGETPFYLSDLPVNSYFVISGAGASEPAVPPLATLVHYVQQKGCSLTGSAVAKTHSDPELVRRFVEVSENRRGILCSVEHPVEEAVALRAGQHVFFRFPMGSCY